jgi:hypothetical protein
MLELVHDPLDGLALRGRLMGSHLQFLASMDHKPEGAGRRPFASGTFTLIASRRE